ncbi:lipopolysaccharide biosynthesis protein [Ramlibacter sp. AN1133]|uniref:lipopolysaccharide biosynthesis protein n=1 Tax=Ramlibacter sp. AN1133 TaxID=3133429 RepID=UPI0030C57780
MATDETGAVKTPAMRRQLWYLPVLGAGMALLMLRVLLMARLLDVPGFARYSMGLVVATVFCMLGALGLYPLLQREMPIQLAHGQRRRALLLLAQALLVATGCALVGMLAALLPRAIAGLSGIAFAVAVLNGLSQQAFLVATTESRSAGEPLRYAWQNFGRAVAIVVASGLVAEWTGSPNLVLGVEAALSLAVSFAIVRRAARRARLPLGLLWRAGAARLGRAPWHTALVFLGISIVASLLTNADRWIGAELLAVDGFAQYAFAGTALVLAQAVQSMVSAAVYPLVARRFATAGLASAFRLAATTSLGLLAAAAAASVPVYFAAAWAIARWYPAYQASTALLPVLLAVCCLRVSDFWSAFLAASRHERLLLALHLAVAIVGCGAWLAWAARSGLKVDPQAIAWLALVLGTGSYASALIASAWIRRAAPPVPAVVALDPSAP